MKFLVISAHDYRSYRKAGIHFVTVELAKLGTTRFFSCQYSLLSQLKSDPRASLATLANKKTVHENVECYLWKTWIHPFNVRKSYLRPIEEFLFRRYLKKPNQVLVDWIAEADVIFFESGIAPIFFDLVTQSNPQARTIYVASDDLATINVAAYVKATFDRVAPQMTALCLKSRYMSDGMPKSSNQYVIPHGFDFSVAEHADPSPYPGGGVHAVSIGSMLFDPEFFVIASKRFPEVVFHIIGSGTGTQPGYGENVRVYDEMPHRFTLPYIKHASFGIAPYRSANLPRYLADTSLKLMQYDFFKLPAVCPNSIVGDYASRFGYEPGNGESIAAAIDAALAAPRTSSRMPLHWSQVVERMLNPAQFEDARLPAA
ncbi:glycosyl transferase family 1 [Thiobacillus denitrificans]|uniref:Glycosyl transferase family 1 n=1 Tax=Thiobacillus denitrificans TaxID=36861 RepID=A0A119CVC7_THIDE|nr:glycosyl transferase family 1 [Thiobacillus denitrificans]KVW94969.1 glycosyl transferase family 1 [Thiobacillus denitrificans]